LTDLSPAARAVLKAACIHHGLFNEEIIQRRRMIAAALRAVVEHLGEAHAGFDLADRYARFVEADDILAIAAELEGME
jgi:hypothetical protein